MRLVNKSLLIGLSATAIIGVAAFGGFMLLGQQKTSPPTSVVERSTNTLGAKTATATLEIFAPPVFIQLPGTSEKVTAQDKQEITEGTTISTGDGGRAQLVYDTHTVTRIDVNSEIVVGKLTTDPTQIHIDLKKNRIWSRVAKLAGLEKYENKSPTVLATVRGTSFGMGILPDGTTKVTTTKGAVDATCQEKAADATVNKDRIIVFNCDEEDTSRESEINRSTQDEWFEFNELEDKKLKERFGDVYKDEEDVLGAFSGDVLGDTTLLPSPTPAPRALAVNLINCVGPDGITSRQTQADCDGMNKFWREHPPAPFNGGNTNSSNNSSNSSSNSNQTPAASPQPSANEGKNNENTLPSPNASPNETVSPVVDQISASVDTQQPSCTVYTSFRATDDSTIVSPGQISGVFYDIEGIPLGDQFTSVDANLSQEGLPYYGSATLNITFPQFADRLRWSIHVQDIYENMTVVEVLEFDILNVGNGQCRIGLAA